MLETPNPAVHEQIPRAFIDDVCARLAANKPVRRKLPGGGRLNIDRLLPFLCIYRRNASRQDAGTDLFVHAEAAFLSSPGDAPVRKGLKLLVRRIARLAAERLGGFLIIEIWSGLDSEVPQTFDPVTGEAEWPPPAFRILTRVPHRPQGTSETLAYALQQMKVHGQAAQSSIDLHANNYPPKMSPFISLAEAQKINCRVVGLEIRPIYRDRATGEVYPDVLQTLRRGVGRALKKAFFTFAEHQTSVRPQHYFELGRKSLPKSVWEVDRQLAAVSSQFKFLLQVTPVNAERSWQQFSESKFKQEPEFLYRPLDRDPLLLKRELLQIPTEQIEDPTLAHLLRQTQDELDRQITMLADVGTPRFLPGSVQVFGGVEHDLLTLARGILKLPPAPRRHKAELNARQFARLAEKEIRLYRKQLPSFAAQAIICDDMYSGLLSTGGNLLVGRETSIPENRAAALLQHEIGTHLVTYYNGQQQPLGLLRVGLAGYDGLQEGLAVLSEYLVGGLNRARLRLLAARVLAAHDLIRGRPLSETYRCLTDQYGFEPRPAYTVALRVHRGGGLTKDAVYLRGLSEILSYVQRGGRIKPLLVGKIAVDHIPIIEELQHRGVLRAATLTPSYLTDDAAAERLARLRGSRGTVLSLLDDEV